jgi:DNA-binding PadR family transcriptional regulator
MFLQVLFVLGELRTIDMTRALPEDALSDVAYGSGQVIQRLEHSRLIESVPREGGKQVSYRLTAKGKFATAILNRLRPPPSAGDLRAEMDRRRQRHTERMRQVGLKNSTTACAGSPTQEAALRALRTFGPLTQRQINEAMDIKFKHPRSLDLALHEMEKRGVVRRSKSAEGNLRKGLNGAQLWEHIESS